MNQESRISPRAMEAAMTARIFRDMLADTPNSIVERLTYRGEEQEVNLDSPRAHPSFTDTSAALNRLSQYIDRLLSGERFMADRNPLLRVASANGMIFDLSLESFSKSALGDDGVLLISAGKSESLPGTRTSMQLTQDLRIAVKTEGGALIRRQQAILPMREIMDARKRHQSRVEKENERIAAQEMSKGVLPDNPSTLPIDDPLWSLEEENQTQEPSVPSRPFLFDDPEMAKPLGEPTAISAPPPAPIPSFVQPPPVAPAPSPSVIEAQKVSAQLAKFSEKSLLNQQTAEIAKPTVSPQPPSPIVSVAPVAPPIVYTRAPQPPANISSPSPAVATVPYDEAHTPYVGSLDQVLASLDAQAEAEPPIADNTDITALLSSSFEEGQRRAEQYVKNSPGRKDSTIAPPPTEELVDIQTEEQKNDPPMSNSIHTASALAHMIAQEEVTPLVSEPFPSIPPDQWIGAQSDQESAAALATTIEKVVASDLLEEEEPAPATITPQDKPESMLAEETPQVQSAPILEATSEISALSTEQSSQAPTLVEHTVPLEPVAPDASETSDAVQATQETTQEVLETKQQESTLEPVVNELAVNVEQNTASIQTSIDTQTVFHTPYSEVPNQPKEQLVPEAHIHWATVEPLPEEAPSEPATDQVHEPMTQPAVAVVSPAIPVQSEPVESASPLADSTPDRAPTPVAPLAVATAVATSTLQSLPLTPVLPAGQVSWHQVSFSLMPDQLPALLEALEPFDDFEMKLVHKADKYFLELAIPKSSLSAISPLVSRYKVGPIILKPRKVAPQ